MGIAIALGLSVGCAAPPPPPAPELPPEPVFEDVEAVTSLSGLMPLLESSCRDLQGFYVAGQPELLETPARKLRAGARRIPILFPLAFETSPSEMLSLSKRLQKGADLLIKSSAKTDLLLAQEALNEIQATCSACHLRYRN